MGERHQIYARLPPVFYGDGNPNNKPAMTIGVHHQWLYGNTAISLLANFLTFYKQCDEFSPFKGKIGSQAIDILGALYSIDWETGYYNSVCELDSECSDPRKEGNNCGITIIDLSVIGHPKYCFMSINGIEEDDELSVPNFVPLSAETYLTAYYPELLSNGMADGELVDNKTMKSIKKKLSVINKVPLMKVADVLAIFPSLKDVLSLPAIAASI